MNRRLAKWLKWGLPVVWETDDSPPEAVTATVTPVVHVHYHLHVEPGADAAATLQQADALRTGVRHYPPLDP